MKVNEILNFFLEQDYSVSRSELNHIDYLVMNMPNANCQLYISCPNCTEVIFKFRYLSDNNGQGVMNFPKLSVNNIEEIKPFLNELYNKLHKDLNSLPSEFSLEGNKIIDLFKIILAEEELPPEYSFEFKKNNKNASGVIYLTNKLTNKVSILDFHHLDLGFLPKGITSPIGFLQILLQTNVNIKSNSSKDKPFSFIIPGYDLDKYPLLQKYNMIEKTHTNVDDWVKELANFPNIDRGPINVGLQSLILNEKLSENTQNKKNKAKL